MKIRLANVGCRLNVAELQEIERGLVRSGHTIASSDESPDLFVVNTCAVTHAAEADSRRMVSRLQRNHPGARLVVTGCYAELRGAELAGKVEQIVGNADKDALVSSLTRGEGASLSPVPADQPFRTRTFLKVQDGCDCRCRFCIITVARGSSRSVPEDEVLANVRERVAAGDPELVLTGVHLGSYGADLEPASSLTRLVARILRETAVPRLRLSSIEPWELTPPLLDLFSGGLFSEEPVGGDRDGPNKIESSERDERPGSDDSDAADPRGRRRLLPHLHLPLQSGSETTLRRMGRRTDLAAFQAFLDLSRRRIPDLSVSSDIMVGHPGETDAAFEESLRFVEAARFSRLHVFRYSPREGTLSAAMEDQVDHKTAAARAHRMRELGESMRREYERRFLGREVRVLWDREKRDETGIVRFGLTDHYVRVQRKEGAEACPVGTVTRCRLTQANPGGGFIGAPVMTP